METFSVYQFFADPDAGGLLTVPECKFVSMEEAMEKFVFLTNNVSAKVGITKRVIITDSGDFTNLEWLSGEGITFPPELKGRILSPQTRKTNQPNKGE